MQFQKLALVLEKIEQVSSRLAITELLAQLWRELDPEEAWVAANLIQGQLLPAYENLEFNLSEKMVSRVLARMILLNGGLNNDGLAIDMFGQTDETTILDQVKKKQRQYGDWGQTTEALHQEIIQEPKNALTIRDVYLKLKTIALTNGEGSQEIKIDLLSQLYQELDSLSAKIATRIVIGKMRLGFSLMTILDSLSWAGKSSKIESKVLEEIFQKKADIGLLAQSYLQLLDQESSTRLEILNKNYQIEVGVPVVPALCQRLNSSQEIIEKMGIVIAEPKYDGMRVQIHLRKKLDQIEVMAFTRNLENVSAMFPELQELAKIIPAKTAIFDSEAIGFNKETGELLAFQETMTRRRKHNIAQKSIDLPMKFFIFDVLYLDNEELLLSPLEDRKAILAKLIQDTRWSTRASFITTDNPLTLHEYHTKQLNLGLEGMVAKTQAGSYQSGRKGWNWVKIKEEEGTRGKLNDTLDLVVMGIYLGKGKRHDFGVGAFLVGLPDENGNLVTLSKVGTGLTDETFRELKQKSEILKTQTKPTLYQVNKMIQPDVWLLPELIAEIAADEITNSTIHTSGYGLRFPRLIKWRSDKTTDQATTTAELKEVRVA